MALARTAAAARKNQVVLHHGGEMVNEKTAGFLLQTPRAERQWTSNRYVPGGKRE
jgi:hypothetical protein